MKKKCLDSSLLNSGAKSIYVLGKMTQRVSDSSLPKAQWNQNGVRDFLKSYFLAKFVDFSIFDTLHSLKKNIDLMP